MSNSATADLDGADPQFIFPVVAMDSGFAHFAPGMRLMTPRTATLIGLTAILMWSLLAVLTVATGMIPAFQLAAMKVVIGALTVFVTWVGSPNGFRALRQPALASIVGAGRLFGYHPLYFPA